MKFESVLGHQHIKAQLINSVVENKVAHAMLFSSKEGYGALALALAYAQFLNCENRSETDSCGTCNSCNKHQKLIHPDLIFTIPAYKLNSAKPALSSDFIHKWRDFILKDTNFTLQEWMTHIADENKKGNISAEECNQLIKKVSLKNFEGTYKIVIIYMAELLAKEANRILKILEEPPLHTIFILITFKLEEILGTITSRTQIVNLPSYTEEEIEKYLVEKYTELDPNSAKQIANLADGSLVAAKNIMNDAFVNFSNLLLQWFRCVFKNDAASIDLIINEINALKREGQKNFLKYTLNLLRDTVIFSFSNKENRRLIENENKLIAYLAQMLTVDQIEKISKSIDDLFYYIDRNANAKIQFFYMFTKHVRLISA